MAATHRYLLVIPPSPEVSAAVESMRERLHARIGGFSGRNLAPHITLFLSDAADGWDHALADALAAAAARMPAFGLSYTGITHFPDRRTIYIDPVEKEAIAALREGMARAASGVIAIREGLRITEHPHLTIAAGLKPAQFDAAWDLLRPHAFGAQHRAGHLLLLKRALKPSGLYAEIARMRLVEPGSAP
jgi:2'-5' RNA ligase